jgi:hypothetical protein
MSNITTPNMGMVLPSDHDPSSSDLWGLLLNAALTVADGHNHTAGQGVAIPVGALNWNANLQAASGGSNFGIYDAAFFDFIPVLPASMATFAGALFVSSVDNNLYYRTTSGSNVQVTNGAALNFSAFVGGIGGDYSAVGALESFDDATHRYLFQQEGSPRPWAGLAAGNIDIYQQAASIANKVTLKSPNALAASYALTLPAALPGSQATLRVDGSGNVTAATVSPTFTLSIPPSAADLNSNARVNDAGGLIAITLSGGTGNAGQSAFPVELQIGDTITSVKVYVNKASSASSTISASLRGFLAAIGANATADTATLATNAPGNTSFTITGLSRTLVAGVVYSVSVGMSVGAAVTDTVVGIEVTFTRPIA